MNAAHPAGAGAPADSTPSASPAVSTTAATNQATPLTGYDVVQSDLALVEALECLGGNGYVEESGLPLVFRESPLNSIWEGRPAGPELATLTRRTTPTPR